MCSVNTWLLNYPKGNDMNIKYVWDLNKAIEQGKFAWPGGYPIYFICADGEALSFDAVVENAELVRDAIIQHDTHSGWCVVASDINWEDNELYCAHTNERIESAYGEE